jgi:predicted ATPase
MVEWLRRTEVRLGLLTNVGREGEAAPAALLAARDRRLNWRPRQRYRPFHEVAAHWLKELGLIDDFEVNPIAPDRKLFEVVIQQAPGGPWVNLVDVDFGVSQVLPIVIQSFYVGKGSTVIFE